MRRGDNWYCIVVTKSMRDDERQVGDRERDKSGKTGGLGEVCLKNVDEKTLLLASFFFLPFQSQQHPRSSVVFSGVAHL